MRRGAVDRGGGWWGRENRRKAGQESGPRDEGSDVMKGERKEGGEGQGWQG